MNDLPTFINRIVVVGGTIDGTVTPGDLFAFAATKVNQVKIGDGVVVLNPGPKNDDLAVGTTGDFRLWER